MITPSVIVLFALLFVVGSFATDYCKRTLCWNGQPHIGCNNKNKFASTCDSPSLVDFGKKLQNVVLNTHNDYRNKLASGATQFAPAARMPRLKWNSELAKLAEYNVRQCDMKHDECRNTDSFEYAGQNLGLWYAWDGLSAAVIETYVKKVIDMWHSESSSAKQAWLDMYTLNTNGKVIGHFTGMICDRTTDIGCAASIYKMKSGSNKFDTVLLACNYGYGNMFNYPIYNKGSPTSKCKTGRDKTYTSLCSSAEVVKRNLKNLIKKNSRNSAL